MGSSRLPDSLALKASTSSDWKGSTSGVDGTNSWRAIGIAGALDREFKLHTIVLPPPPPSSAFGVAGIEPESTTISCLLNPTLIPRLPSPLPPSVPPLSNPPFEILLTEKKGAGMFAVRDIEAGELIVDEHPALILPADKFPDEVYEKLGEALDTKRREALMRMANCRSPEECRTYVEGVVRTNAMVLDLLPVKLKGSRPLSREEEEGDKETYGGVYPLINRCNHSCGPNAGVKWKLSTLSQSLIALRDIKAGEEIHKAYVNPILPRATRMKMLEKNYRFTCDCPHCDIRQSSSSSPSTGVVAADLSPFTPEELTRIAESDRRRELLGTWIFTHLGYKKWSTDLCREDDIIIREHQEALALVEVEAVQSLQTLFVEEIALAYAMVGDVDGFKKWGERLVKLVRVEDPVTKAKFEDWLVDPERRVKKWGWRKMQRDQMRKMKTGLDLDTDIFQGFFQDID